MFDFPGPAEDGFNLTVMTAGYSAPAGKIVFFRTSGSVSPLLTQDDIENVLILVPHLQLLYY